MSLLPDWKIRQLCDPKLNAKPMISPFVGTSVKKIEVDPLVGKVEEFVKGSQVPGTTSVCPLRT